MSVKDSPDGMSSTCEAALTYARLGWPVFPLRPREKTPATAHGFEDASVDEDQIRRWWTPASLTNIAIVTGAPGPCVVDVDAPEHFPPELAAQLMAVNPPTVATARGTHYYFAGTDETTIALRAGEHKYGELRGKGSYVAAPPSIHPSGKVYIWTSELNGTLPARPVELGVAEPRGAGDLTLERRITHGERHDFLVDIAVRQVRGGILDENLIVTVLEAAFAQHCDPSPAPRATEFSSIAQWALGSAIAGRERTKAKDPEATTPDRDAPLNEHRTYLERLAGIAPIRMLDPIRHGPLLSDPCTIPLSNGLMIYLARLEEMLAPRGWSGAVIVGTNGQANPRSLKPAERFHALQSLCILAGAPKQDAARQELRDAVTDFLGLTATEVVDFGSSPTKYEALVRLYALPVWEARKPSYTPSQVESALPQQVGPVLILDTASGNRYVRSGHLYDFLSWRGLVKAGDYHSKLSQIGLTDISIAGRESREKAGEGAKRGTRHMRLIDVSPMDHLDVPDDPET